MVREALTASQIAARLLTFPPSTRHRPRAVRVGRAQSPAQG